jgi:hypothetical protein
MHTFVSTWGSRPRIFRLSEISLRVCYFWSSSFRMDEGNPLPCEQRLWILRQPFSSVVPERLWCFHQAEIGAAHRAVLLFTLSN